MRHVTLLQLALRADATALRSAKPSCATLPPAIWPAIGRWLAAEEAPPDWIRARPIAHRGLHDARYPENSMAAFDAAARAGHPIELDVRGLADGEVVVFHDVDLHRMTGARGPVAERRSADLAPLRLADTAEPVPLLREVLELVQGRVPLLVEIKNGADAGPLEAEVARLLDGYAGEVAVQSFNPWTVRWFRRHRPAVPRGVLSCDFAGERLPAHERFVLRRLALLPALLPHFIGYDLAALPTWPTDLARRCGVVLLAWTVRTDADLARAATLADNIIFEHVRPTGTPRAERDRPD